MSISTLRDALRPRTRLRIAASYVRALGAVQAARYAFQTRAGVPEGKTVTVRPRRARYPLHVRAGTSDVAVFRTTFIEPEHGPLQDLKGVTLVLDCGANVGYTSALFLSDFPACRLVAVEPDPDNYRQLERNLASYGDRVVLVRAGVWSSTTPLVLVDAPYRDGGAWSRQVRPCQPGEAPDFEGVSVETLAELGGGGRISLLKMDIEGAEAVVFAERPLAWLARTDALAIELHDDSMFGEASGLFNAAIASEPFDVSGSGELTICIRQPNLA